MKDPTTNQPQVSPDSASETSSSDDDNDDNHNNDHQKKGSILARATTTTTTATTSCSCTSTISTTSQTTKKLAASCFMCLVWPLMLTVPLLLSNTPSSPLFYESIFPSSWYQYSSFSSKPKPLGLFLGIAAVAVGQVWVWILFYLYKTWAQPRSVQTKGARVYDYFGEGLVTHVSQPEGFALLVGYLAITWLLHLLPSSYYSFEGTIQWKELAFCLIVQDAIQYTMHLLEHLVSPSFYQISHKPHHRFTNPRLFDAFNGSLLDTLCMITVPLFLTSHIVRTANVWTYMAFGSTYACWLTLIHSEYAFPWDFMFRKLGLGTPADHHVHHKFFKYNYGHLFMWMDRICGTYREPQQFAPKVFRERV